MKIMHFERKTIDDQKNFLKMIVSMEKIDLSHAQNAYVVEDDDVLLDHFQRVDKEIVDRMPYRIYPINDYVFGFDVVTIEPTQVPKSVFFSDQLDRVKTRSCYLREFCLNPLLSNDH